MEGMNDPRWRKSTKSGSNGGGCVEVGNHPHGVIIRDTQDPRWPDGAPVIKFSTATWRSFTASLERLGRLRRVLHAPQTAPESRSPRTRLARGLRRVSGRLADHGSAAFAGDPSAGSH